MKNYTGKKHTLKCPISNNMAIEISRKLNRNIISNVKDFISCIALLC